MDVKGFLAGRAFHAFARLKGLSQPGHPPEASNSQFLFCRAKDVSGAVILIVGK